MVKLLGYRDGVSKKTGNAYTQMFIVQDLNPAEKASGCVGQKTDMIFMPEEQIGTLKPQDIGKELELSYEISGRNAFLSKVVIK